jgi:NAD(P)H-dependent FMN reductase
MSLAPPFQKILFLVASARPDGNTEQLARLAAQALPAEAEQEWLRLADHPLDPFVDRRHEPGGYPPPEGHARRLLEATLAASDLVMASPTYWYSLPAAAKLYLDHWSWWMRLAGVNFRERMAGKRFWAITVCSNEPGDDTGTEPLIDTLRLSAKYLGMHWMGALIGHGNRPGEVMGDTAAVERARTWFMEGADRRSR